MNKPLNASDAAALRRALINLASLMLLMILSVGIAGLFSVWSINRFQTRTQLALNEVGAAMLDARQAQVHFKTQVQEWKNTLLRGHDLEDRAKYIAAFEAEMHQTQILLDDIPAKLDHIAHIEVLANLEKGGESSGVKGISVRMKDDVIHILAEFLAVNEAYAVALDNAQTDGGWNPGQADSDVRGTDRVLTEQLEAIPVQLARAHSDLVLLASREAESRFAMLSRLVWTAIVLALGLVSLTLWKILKHPALVK